MDSPKEVFEVIKSKESIEITFSSTLENIDRSCIEINDFLSSASENIASELFAINLVTREGLSNAVRHGNKKDPEKTVHLFLEIIEDKSLKMRIEDQGDGFNWRELDEFLLDEDSESGRGLIIIETYFTSFGYNDKGNVLYLQKDFFI